MSLHPLRPMLPKDAAQVAQVHTLSWQHAYRGIVDQSFLDAIDVKEREKSWLKGLETPDPPVIRLIDEEDGKIRGFACGLENREQKLLPESDSELWAIYVHPENTRGGVGSRLLRHFAAELKKLGKTRFCVWVLRDNAPAREFYERQGGRLTAANKDVKLGSQLLPHVSYEFALSVIDSIE